MCSGGSLLGYRRMDKWLWPSWISKDGWATDLGLLTSDHKLKTTGVPQYPPQMLRFTDTFTRD